MVNHTLQMNSLKHWQVFSSPFPTHAYSQKIWLGSRDLILMLTYISLKQTSHLYMNRACFLHFFVNGILEAIIGTDYRRLICQRIRRRFASASPNLCLCTYPVSLAEPRLLNQQSICDYSASDRGLRRRGSARLGCACACAIRQNPQPYEFALPCYSRIVSEKAKPNQGSLKVDASGYALCIVFPVSLMSEVSS